MKKLLFSLIVLSFIACRKKEWNKDYMVNQCLGDFRKRNEKEKVFSDMQVAKLCDCVAEKAVAKYKSEAALNKDKAGATAIGQACALELMSKENK